MIMNQDNIDRFKERLERFSKPFNLVVVDFDGVLNHEQFYIERNDKLLSGEITEKDFDDETGYERWCERSVKNLNILIKETQSKIVISSTWRSDGLERMLELWNHRNMEGEIIGLTPKLRVTSGVYSTVTLFSAERGSEINYWLKSANYNASFVSDPDYVHNTMINNYVILDDD